MIANGPSKPAAWRRCSPNCACHCACPVAALAANDGWLEIGIHVLCFGPPGSGKSHPAALGQAVVENGFRVPFTRTTDLVQRPQVARQAGAMPSASCSPCKPNTPPSSTRCPTPPRHRHAQALQEIIDFDLDALAAIPLPRSYGRD
jgi:hypothetical protein